VQEEPPLPKVVDNKKLEQKRLAKDWYTLLPQHVAVVNKRKRQAQHAKMVEHAKKLNATSTGKLSIKTSKAQPHVYEVVDVTQAAKSDVDASDEEPGGEKAAVVRAFELRGRNGTTVRLVKVKKKKDKKVLAMLSMENRMNQKAFAALVK
jgi:hypothetical protein